MEQYDDTMIMFETNCCGGEIMTKTYYHATPFENLESILDQGLHKGCDGVVYLTEKPDEAIRFLMIRGYKEILVCEVQVNEDMIIEMFDHNPNFFKCRAFGYCDNISSDDITNYLKYELN